MRLGGALLSAAALVGASTVVAAAILTACTSTAPVTVDAGLDAQIGDGGIQTEAGTCGPNEGGASGPMTPPETPAHAGRCSDTQVDDYAACQTDTTSLCGEFLAGQPGAGCAACIETQSTAAAWGVLVFTGSQQARFNYGGCVDLALGQVGQPDSCGQRIFESYGCQEAACVLCEGQQQIGGGDAFAACSALSIASGGVCASYDARVQDPNGPCAPLLDPDAAAGVGYDCFPDPALDPAGGAQQKEFLRRIVHFFCGPADDAGP
ncbi:MAG TPA: hypothetical protein VLM85_13385 [Polyangiaceae bacterium]|nr:hypothetical protein [Polyangiaceae bacterium]